MHERVSDTATSGTCTKGRKRMVFRSKPRKLLEGTKLALLETLG